MAVHVCGIAESVMFAFSPYVDVFADTYREFRADLGTMVIDRGKHVCAGKVEGEQYDGQRGHRVPEDVSVLFHT